MGKTVSLIFYQYLTVTQKMHNRSEQSTAHGPPVQFMSPTRPWENTQNVGNSHYGRPME